MLSQYKEPDNGHGMDRIAPLLGILTFLGVAYLFGKRSGAKVNKRTFFWGLGLQFVFAVAVLGIPALGFEGPLRFVFEFLNTFFVKVLDFSLEGSRFVFGPLADITKAQGFIFAVMVLPSIIFFSSLVAVLYFLGVMQKIVQAIAWVMSRSMHTSGAESLASAANIFLGQTEAPLAIKPFLKRATQSELFAIMVGGMANVAGGVLAAYVGLLKDRIPDIAGHLMTVSVLTAPGSLLIAKLMVPEKTATETGSNVDLQASSKIDQSLVESAARGAKEGMELAINVAAMLIAFIALVALVNAGLGAFGRWIHFDQWGAQYLPQIWITAGKSSELSLQLIFGVLLAPIAWLLGVPWSEAPLIGALLGEKVALNEFVAYLSLTDLSAHLSDRSVVIASYALCGFANFSSIGIQIGGIGAMVPERQGELGRLGIKALVGGTLSTFLAAAIAALLL